MKKILSFLIFIILADAYPQTMKSKLPNGLTVIASKREVRQLVSIVALIKGGSGVEETAGAGSLLLKLMSLGTVKYTKDEIAQILEDNLIDIQTEINPNYWAFIIFCPSKSLEQALVLLKEILFSPLFDEYEFEREKKKAISEVEEASSQPFVFGYARLREIIYGNNHPYARLLCGTKSSIKKLSLEEMRSLHLNYFQPQNIFLSIVGDFEPESAKKITNDIFGVLPRGDRPSFNYPFYRPLLRPEAEVIERPAPFAYILLGTPLPGINHPDYPALEVVNTILGEGASSRIAKALRWRMGLSYDFGSLYPHFLGESHLLLWAAVDPQRVEEAREALINEILSLENIEQKELEKAKNKLIGNQLLSLSSIKEIAFRMAFFEATGLGYKYAENFPTIVNALTIKDVQRVVRRYFKANTASVLVMPSL